MSYKRSENLHRIRVGCTLECERKLNFNLVFFNVNPMRTKSKHSNALHFENTYSQIML